MSGGIDIKHAGGRTSLSVKVVPGSSRTMFAGVLNGMLKVKVSAPAEKGKANETLIAFLAGRLGIRDRDITIVSGHTSQVKHLEIAGSFDESVFKDLVAAK